MNQFSRFKNTSSMWFSRPFYSSEGGYKLQLGIDANGAGDKLAVEVAVHLMDGEHDEQLKWPFNANITIQLLNWTRDSDHIEKTIHHHQAPLEYRTRVMEGGEARSDYLQFISHFALMYSDYISEDNLCFKIISVDIIE